MRALDVSGLSDPARFLVSKTCQRCEHWWESESNKRHCSNDAVIGMLNSYDDAWFEPPLHRISKYRIAVVDNGTLR
jgi:hypothetical protein